MVDGFTIFRQFFSSCTVKKFKNNCSFKCVTKLFQTIITENYDNLNSFSVTFNSSLVAINCDINWRYFMKINIADITIIFLSIVVCNLNIRHIKYSDEKRLLP